LVYPAGRPPTWQEAQILTETKLLNVEERPSAAFVIDNPESWRALMPALGVCDDRNKGTLKTFNIEPATTAELNRLLQREGYFQLPPVNWELPWTAMAEAVAGLRARGLSTAFAFIYDEFWLAFGKLHWLLVGVLGESYRLLPDFWAWCIDPASDDAGWTPHRDKNGEALRPDGSPKSVTVWLPLTDATPLNGCMYVVPADRDPGYPNSNDREFALPDIRALPAQAGSILCWNQAVYHWGAHSVGRAGGQRISVAFEFQRGDEPPFNAPLLQPGSLPEFPTRLALICKQILQYQHMYRIPPQMVELAQAILARNNAGSAQPIRPNPA